MHHFDQLKMVTYFLIVVFYWKDCSGRRLVYSL